MAEKLMQNQRGRAITVEKAHFKRLSHLLSWCSPTFRFGIRSETALFDRSRCHYTKNAVNAGTAMELRCSDKLLYVSPM